MVGILLQPLDLASIYREDVRLSGVFGVNVRGGVEGTDRRTKWGRVLGFRRGEGIDAGFFGLAGAESVEDAAIGGHSSMGEADRVGGGRIRP